MHVFPNISENLTRSLLKMKSAVLAMAVSPKAVLARQPGKEKQADHAVNSPGDILPPKVTDIVSVPDAEEPSNIEIRKDEQRVRKETLAAIIPVKASPGTNITSLPGAA